QFPGAENASRNLLLSQSSVSIVASCQRCRYSFACQQNVLVAFFLLFARLCILAPGRCEQRTKMSRYGCRPHTWCDAAVTGTCDINLHHKPTSKPLLPLPEQQ